MYTTFAVKSAITAAVVALHGLTGVAFELATDTAAPEAVVQLERVVVTGHRAEAVQQLPRVVIEGHRSVEGAKLASAGE